MRRCLSGRKCLKGAHIMKPVRKLKQSLPEYPLTLKQVIIYDEWQPFVSLFDL